MYKAPDVFQEGLRRFLAEGGFTWVERPGPPPPGVKILKNAHPPRIVELEKLAYAAVGAPFVPAGVKEYSREEAFKVLREAPDPYEKFKKIASETNAGRVKLAEPWKSLRLLIGKAHRELDEGKKKALFYAVLALEEAFGVYRTALGEYAEGLKKAVRREEVGKEPFKRVVYAADLKQIKQLAKEEEADFEEALNALRRNLNEYAHRYGVEDLLDVKEDVARRLAEAKQAELSEFNDVNFGVKAYAALIAYREYALGRRGAFGKAAWHWLEVGGSAWVLYYAPGTAYDRAKRAKVERPAAVEEMVTEAFRRLFLKPGADHYRGFVEELKEGGKLALMFDSENESSYIFKLFRVEEGGKLVELEGVRLSIKEAGESIVYVLYLDAERRELFRQELEAGMKAAEEVGGRLPVEDRLLYMLGWVDSDVAIIRMGNKRVLQMGTSHLWQLAETHALFGWSDVLVPHVGLSLEGPKPQFYARTSLDKLNDAIRRSVEGGWLKMLSDRGKLEDLKHVKSWDNLKRWVAEHWDEVIKAVKKRLESVKAGSGFDLAGALKELEGLKNELDDDKISRGVVAPALLLIQAERLGVDEATLKYFGAVVSGTVGGDGSVSAAWKEVSLSSGEGAVALLWAAA